MANRSGEKTPPDGVTAAGLVEALEQDVELSMEQVKNVAQEAIAAVEKKLARKPASKKPPTKVAKKVTAKAPAKKEPAKSAKATTSKDKKRK